MKKTFKNVKRVTPASRKKKEKVNTASSQVSLKEKEVDYDMLRQVQVAKLMHQCKLVHNVP